jgi:cytochrome c1
VNQKEIFQALLISSDYIVGISKLMLLLICLLIIKEMVQNSGNTSVVAGEVFRCGVSDYPSQKGKNLFINNCAQCHAKDMRTTLTGPPLINAAEEWNKFPTQDLYEWIRHSQKMIKKGHPRARELWRQYRPTVMNDFPNLSDTEIDAIFEYVRGQARYNN